MSKRWIHGTFEDEHQLLAATAAVREQGYRVEDIFTPYPVHGLPALDIADLEGSL